MKRQNILLLIMVCVTFSASAQTLTKIWTTAEGLKTPESALFDATSNVIYVANIDGDASAKDGKWEINSLARRQANRQSEWIMG